MKKITFLAVCFTITLVMAACGRAGTSVSAPSDIPKEQIKDNSDVPENYEFLGEVELAWKDNSLDDWQAVINLPLKELKADGEQLGGAIRYFAGEGGAVRFKNHLVGSYKKTGAELAESI